MSQNLLELRYKSKPVCYCTIKRRQSRVMKENYSKVSKRFKVSIHPQDKTEVKTCLFLLSRYKAGKSYIKENYSYACKRLQVSKPHQSETKVKTCLFLLNRYKGSKSYIINNYSKVIKKPCVLKSP